MYIKQFTKYKYNRYVHKTISINITDMYIKQFTKYKYNRYVHKTIH